MRTVHVLAIRGLLLTVFATMLCSGSLRAQIPGGHVSLDHIDNSNYHGDSVAIGNITFYIKIEVPDSGLGTYAVNLPFVVYSPDGAMWSQLNGMRIDGTGDYSHASLNAVAYRNADGQGRDTIFWDMSTIGGMPPGIWAPGTVTVPFKISLKIGSSSIGKTICLDSAYFVPPAATWAIADYDLTAWLPSWGGQYCFTVTDCCEGMKGNFDDPGATNANILDVTKFVSYLFAAGPPPFCASEMDMDNNNKYNVIDISLLTSWLFAGGQGTSCP